MESRIAQKSSAVHGSKEILKAHANFHAAIGLMDECTEWQSFCCNMEQTRTSSLLCTGRCALHYARMYFEELGLMDLFGWITVL
jgi:hypothetical protein